MRDAFGVDRPDIVSKSEDGRRKVAHALSNPLIMAPAGAAAVGAPIAATQAAVNARSNRALKRTLVNDQAFMDGISRPEQLKRYALYKKPLTTGAARPAAAGALVGGALFGGGAAYSHHLTNKGKKQP